MNFPVLRLLKDDFINYYNQDDFSKLIIQYQVATQDTSSYVYLVFYAFNTQNYPINTQPINFIYNPSDPIVMIDSTFYLGNIELSKEEIEKALCNSDFSYFSFKAEKSKYGYIGFEINPAISQLVKVKNPCPPDCPHPPTPIPLK